MVFWTYIGMRTSELKHPWRGWKLEAVFDHSIKLNSWSPCGFQENLDLSDTVTAFDLHQHINWSSNHQLTSAEMLVTVMSRSVSWPKLLGRTFSNSSISRDFMCCQSLCSPPHARSSLGSSPHTRSYSQKTHKMEVSKGRFCFTFFTVEGGFLIVLLMAS